MAVTVAAGDNGYAELALVANTEQQVTMADDWDTVEVTAADATAWVYFTVDGSAPATGAGSKKGHWLTSGTSALQVDVPTAGATVVRIKSTGTATVGVVGVTKRA